MKINLGHIFQARNNIAVIARNTPQIQLSLPSLGQERNVFLKLENLQETGAFKVRGAANKILSLDEKLRSSGVIAVSTGNHGRAVAFVAKKLEIPATICISEKVPQNKLDNIRKLGAETVIVGQSQDEAEIHANQLIKAHGHTMIHPFDDPWIIAGQGTIGLELMESLPHLDTVIVPLSGGGLISGIALAVKSINPHIHVVGVSMQDGAVMAQSLQAGKPIELPEANTLADSLQGGIGLQNQYTFDMVNDLVDEIVLVSETEIAEAMAYLFKEEHLVVEGASAVGVAALLNQKIEKLGGNIAVVISGSNVDPHAFVQTIQPYLV